MRLDLDADPSKFLRQVEHLRRSLGSIQEGDGPEPVSARIGLSVFVPFVTALRAELRHDVVPGHVMAAVAELVAVISKTTVQTLIQAPPAIEGAEIERLCVAAVERACISLAQEAEAAAAKPKLQLVADNDAPKTAIHMQTRDVPLEKRRQIVADVTGLDMDDDGPTETGDVGPDGEDPIERELP